MAKGTAGKSASGASMSKYDIEVEARLQALEKAIEECKATCAANAHSHDGGGSDPRVDTIIKVLQANPKINLIDKLLKLKEDLFHLDNHL